MASLMFLLPININNIPIQVYPRIYSYHQFSASSINTIVTLCHSPIYWRKSILFFDGGIIKAKFIIVNLAMERYNEKIITFDTNNRNINERRLNPISKYKPKKKHATIITSDKSSTTNLKTIDVSNLTDFRIKFQPEQIFIEKGTPGVGEYDISSPFVKPSYETYEKSDQVILVKINHIGGTSSFRSEGQRFIDGNSIYHSNASPGPGTYQIASQRNRKHLSTSTYHQNYGLIQELLRNSRERTQSMPNYKIGVPKTGLEYNGLPKHLQEMYNNLNRDKEAEQTVKSIPLEKLIKLRKKNERLPIVEGRRDESLPSQKQKRPIADKMTETLYRLDEQLKKEQKRIQKIRAILKPSTQARSKSIEQAPQAYRNSNRKQNSFNKNMVNILFERTNK